MATLMATGFQEKSHMGASAPLGSAFAGRQPWQHPADPHRLYSKILLAAILLLVNDGFVGWIGKGVTVAGACVATLCPPASEVISDILSHKDNGVAFQETPATMPEENHKTEQQETVFSITLTDDLVSSPGFNSKERASASDRGKASKQPRREDGRWADRQRPIPPTGIRSMPSGRRERSQPTLRCDG
jgi:hypothetical protein